MTNDKKNKLYRVNVIRNIENTEEIIKDWSPVLKSAGIEKRMDGFHDVMALYCHNHTKNQNELDKIYGSPIPMGGMKSILNTIQPTMALPMIIKMMRDFTLVKNMRIIPVNAPHFAVLIDDLQYVDTIDTIDAEFDIPALSVRDMKTNLFDIYEARMIEYFTDKFEEYIKSIPGADTLIVLSFGEMFVINNMDGQLNPKMKIRYKFRVKALCDEHYFPVTKENEVERRKQV